MTAPPDAPDARLVSLLSRVALQDRAAFEQLYRLTSHFLLGLATGVLGQRERAEEALQEAYVNVWHNAASFNPGIAKPMTWLINIVRNKAIDRLRSGHARRESHIGLEEAMELVADPDLQPERLFADSLLKLRIDECMAALAARERQALALAHYKGLVIAEVAAAMRAPLGTAKAWVRRGGDKLRQCLQAAGVRPA